MMDIKIMQTATARRGAGLRAMVGATGTAGRVVCGPTAAGPAITENAAAFPLFRFAVALSNGFQPPQDGGSAPRRRKQGSRDPARDRCSEDAERLIAAWNERQAKRMP